MSKQIHFNQMFFPFPSSHTVAGWTDAQDDQLAGLSSFKLWQDVARTLERGCFDAVFFGDSPAARDEYQGKPDAGVQYGNGWPTHDPLLFLTAMGAVTERLGLAVTLSISGTPPFLAVRRLTSLDCLTGGRVGWNIVTGHLQSEYRAVGKQLIDHDLRYDVADEYMEICYALWDSVKSDAIVIDKKIAILADPSKVRMVDYQGKYFSCRGILPTLPSPQGRPVLFQAGASGRGMRFAATHAEAVFAIQTELPHMKRFMESVTAAAEEVGRRDPVRVYFGAQAIVGGTEAEAKRRVEELRARIPIEAALSRISGTLGVDLSKFNVDDPLEEMNVKGSQGMLASMRAEVDGRSLTLREVATRFGLSGGFMQMIGTPEQIADKIETVWRETGCHGFNLTPATNPGSVNDFVDQVVPILQKRGLMRTEYTGRTLRDHIEN